MIDEEIRSYCQLVGNRWSDAQDKIDRLTTELYHNITAIADEVSLLINGIAQKGEENNAI